MASESENTADDLRGATRLAVDAVVGVTDIVEAMHHSITTIGGLLGDAERGRTGGLTGFVYNNIRAVTELVGVGLDAALAPLVKAVAAAEPSRGREAVVAALNGVLGDHLARTQNPLAIHMEFRRAGASIDLADGTLQEQLRDRNGRLLLMVHGSSCSDLQWERNGHDHGEMLAEQRGLVPLYLHYNSGRHISQNGEELDAALEHLVEQVPEIRELNILAHSMGGLVARSACHYAAQSGRSWPDRLERIIFLASPHHGAPLEKAGNWVDNILEVSAYSAPLARLGKIRSAGVTDLRFGYILHDDWAGRERFEPGSDEREPVPLPDGVACFAVAAITTENTGHVAENVVGDGLVPLRSALGQHDDPAMTLGFDDDRTLVVRNTGHLDVLCSEEVFDALLEWIDA